VARYIAITDMTLRDGMHSVAHQFTPEQVARVSAALEDAGVDAVEVSHGDGLAGASYNYGFPAASDDELLAAASSVLGKSKLAVLLIPGIGTQEDLRMARGHGAQVVRVATHCTEADISEQHIGLAKNLGMQAVGFLMMAHMLEPEGLVRQAKLMESYGADVVYITDSAGALLPDDVRARVGALREALSCEVGFHAHNNLGVAISNTIAAVEEGASVVDACLCGFGAGAGNAQLEVLVAVLAKMGYQTGIDLYRAMDAAEEVARPLLRRPPIIDRAALTIGYAGVYSSFLLHAFRASERFGVDAREVLMELGRLKVVGGQEDMIVDVAFDLAKRLGKVTAK
jgi:4-hydroxy-2-oxovalerate aldolase